MQNQKIIDTLKNKGFEIVETKQVEGIEPKFVSKIVFENEVIKYDISITHDDTPRGFIKAFTDYAKTFSVESYVEMCLRHKGEEGWPNMREAIYQADMIKSNLQLEAFQLLYLNA